MKHYQKELPSNRLYLKSGKLVPFDLVGDLGILSTDDDALTGELDILIKAHRGGVTEITAEQAEELKKNPPAIKPRPRLLGGIRAQPQLASHRGQENGAADSAAKAPRKVPLPGEKLENPDFTKSAVTMMKVADLKAVEEKSAQAGAQPPNDVQ